jgi:hypothetical protein
MKKENVLRYLLLRHLKELEHKANHELFQETTRSLRISEDSEMYVVRWEASGRLITRSFPKKDFSFYQRGDIDAEVHTLGEDLSTNNDSLARQFAIEALGLQSADLLITESRKRKWPLLELAGHAVSILLLMMIGNINVIPAVILFSIAAVEYFKYGRLYASFLFLMLSFFAPGAVLIGALAYAGLQFFDPDHRLRMTRIWVCLSAVLSAIVWKGIEGADNFHITAFFFLCITAAFLIAAFRSLFYSHRRTLPLAMPFVCAGFALDHQEIAAKLGLFLLAAFALWIIFASKKKLCGKDNSKTSLFFMKISFYIFALALAVTLFIVCNNFDDGASLSAQGNLLWPSEQFEHKNWNPVGLKRVNVNSFVAPDGKKSADAIFENNSSGLHRLETVIQGVTVGKPYVFSIFAQPAGRSTLRIELLDTQQKKYGVAAYDLMTLKLLVKSGSVLRGGIVLLDSDGWVRCWAQTSFGGSVAAISMTLVNSEGSHVYLGDGKSGMIFWGAQLSPGAELSKYKATNNGPIY